MVKSKQKGNTFERKISKYLSQQNDQEFKRVPMSGAYSTNTKVEFPQFVGDVYTTHIPLQDIIIECKHYHGPVELYDIFNPKSDIGRAMKQCERETPKGMDWILFFKSNSRDVVVVAKKKINISRLNLISNKQFMFNDMFGCILKI